MYFGLPLFPLYEHVEASALPFQILKRLQGWRGWRILFISHKIVIRVITLLPGRGGLLLKVYHKYPILYIAESGLSNTHAIYSYD